ncbi:MAG: hypothetical protein EZS28_026410 [Streblomastix strix]|uniref:Uncharacterized protein n=1 Tax=Streblomastix strix TaxID=222440 RepID=A0A5J4V6L0_9EUKA|nr:MAG: hypothetical protein EZS28_026410 [Streblomastix strix]
MKRRLLVVRDAQFAGILAAVRTELRFPAEAPYFLSYAYDDVDRIQISTDGWFRTQATLIFRGLWAEN